MVLNVHFKQPTAFAGAILSAPMAKIADEMKPPQLVVNALIWLSKHKPEAAIAPVPVRCVVCFAGRRCLWVWLPRLTIRSLRVALWRPQDVIELAFKDKTKLAFVRENPCMFECKPRLATARECLGASLELVRVRCANRGRARGLTLPLRVYQEKHLGRVTIPFLCLHGAADRVSASARTGWVPAVAPDICSRLCCR